MLQNGFPPFALSGKHEPTFYTKRCGNCTKGERTDAFGLIGI
jgi:hypothetical protein